MGNNLDSGHEPYLFWSKYSVYELPYLGKEKKKDLRCYFNSNIIVKLYNIN